VHSERVKRRWKVLLVVVGAVAVYGTINVLDKTVRDSVAVPIAAALLWGSILTVVVYAIYRWRARRARSRTAGDVHTMPPSVPKNAD